MRVEAELGLALALLRWEGPLGDLDLGAAPVDLVGLGLLLLLLGGQVIDVGGPGDPGGDPESRKCSRSTPEMKKRSASDKALDWAVVMSCSCAEALGASRQVSVRWDVALAASAPKCWVLPSAPVRSKERLLEASPLASWVM